jgi:hypothetical protein
MILIGIDPGVNTGYAEWDTVTQEFTEVLTMPIHKALAFVHQETMLYDPKDIRVIFEDARMRGNSGAKSAAMAQGAGAVKRDCKIWDDFLTDFGISWQSVSPKAKGAKVSAEYFRKLTGWEGRTSEHARDAAMLVYGRTK